MTVIDLFSGAPQSQMRSHLWALVALALGGNVVPARETKLRAAANNAKLQNIAAPRLSPKMIMPTHVHEELDESHGFASKSRSHQRTNHCEGNIRVTPTHPFRCIYISQLSKCMFAKQNTLQCGWWPTCSKACCAASEAQSKCCVPCSIRIWSCPYKHTNTNHSWIPPCAANKCPRAKGSSSFSRYGCSS